ncbi:MAG: serine/threonine-protein kinase [Myxococcota bacterium]
MANDLSGDETIGDEVTTAVSELGFGDLFAGRYRIDRCVGRGSMGTVYAAYDRVVDETIALKLLAFGGEQSAEDFGREVRLARRVTHRNAARTFDLGEHEGMHFITMELVDGESLRVVLARRGRLLPGEVIDLGLQLGLGLQAAHDVGVIHRDLKPANILLDRDGRAVITDFGVARTTAEEAEGTNVRARMVGTPMYMAPEQVEGGAIAPAVDVYALGLVLYEALTGNAPFGGNNRVEIAMARLAKAPPDPRHGAPVPDPLAELVLRCLARRPTDRPASPSQVVQDLTVQLASMSDSGGSDSGRSTGSGMSSGMSSGLEPVEPASSRALAVMPFRYRGIDEESYLAEVLTDELVDLLAMTKGLRVSSSGAASKFREERDARTVGRALGVDAIIDGTVMRTADRVRIVVRLIDVDTGFQRSTERFEGRLEDVFDLQDRMAKRIAESLRLEVSVLDQGRHAPAEAVELYLRGRKHAREPDVTGRTLEDAFELFNQALQRAPGLPLALAARADVAVHRWFLPASDSTKDWQALAGDAVAAALAGAEHLAETHVAAARLDVNVGRFASAARHLTTALDIAPTCAAAHEYLGLLQCEAGRSREGVRHIELAHELDPSLHMAAFSVVRWWALRGKHKLWRRRMAQMRQSPRFFPVAIDLFEFRLLLWEGDVQAARAIRWRSGGPGSVADRLSAVLRDSLDRGRSDDEIAKRGRELIEWISSSPRLRTSWGQVVTEVLAWRGATEPAMVELSRADGSGVLLDSDWFELCPLLEPLRGDPRFEQMRERIRTRAEAIWRVAD